MKRLERILEKMNDLLIMNCEVEKIYFELLDKTSENGLKGFLQKEALKEMSLEKI